MKRTMVTAIPVQPSIQLASNATFDKFYGVQFPNTESIVRGFIRKSDVYNDYLKLNCLDSFTEGNGWTHNKSSPNSSLPQYISYLLANGYEIYEFDTLSELAKWLEE